MSRFRALDGVDGAPIGRNQGSHTPRSGVTNAAAVPRRWQPRPAMRDDLPLFGGAPDQVRADVGRSMVLVRPRRQEGA